MQQTVVIESLQPAIPGAGAGDPVGSPADGIGRRSPGGSRDPDQGQEAGLRLVCSQPLEHQGREAVPRDHLHGCGPGSGCGTHCRYRRPRRGPPVGLQPGSLSRVGQKRSACKVRMEGFPAAAGTTLRRPRSWPDASTMTFNRTTRLPTVPPGLSGQAQEPGQDGQVALRLHYCPLCRRARCPLPVVRGAVSKESLSLCRPVQRVNFKLR